MKIERMADIINDVRIIETIVQAFVEMVEGQPSNVAIYDYELMFKDYYDVRQQRTLIPAPALPRDKEQAENVIRHIVQDSVSSFADFLLQRDIVLGEPDIIEVTYGIPELGVDDVPDMRVGMMRATLYVTWILKWDQKLGSKKGGAND